MPESAAKNGLPNVSRLAMVTLNRVRTQIGFSRILFRFWRMIRDNTYPFHNEDVETVLHVIKEHCNSFIPPCPSPDLVNLTATMFKWLEDTILEI